MSKQSYPQKQLKIQKGIRQAEDDLVTWIEDALDTAEYGNLEESQFRNLVRFSDTHDSTKAIQNFLRYQMGKDNKWGRGKDCLAERIIEDIDSRIKKTAQFIGECCQADFKPIWLELIRRYLGYGARHLKFKRDGNAA